MDREKGGVEVRIGRMGRRYVTVVAAGLEFPYVRRTVWHPVHGRVHRWALVTGWTGDGVEWLARAVVFRHPRVWYWMAGWMPEGPRLEVGRLEGGWRWVMVSPFSTVWLVWRGVVVLEVGMRAAEEVVGVDPERVRVVEMVMRMGKEMGCER